MNWARLVLLLKSYIMKAVSIICGMLTPTNDESFEETVNMLDTPWKISCWLQANVKYVKDTVDYWQTPVETFNRRKGDCDDYARFAMHCLNRHGYYPSYFLMMWGGKLGHATALYHEVSGWCTVGTFGLVKHDTEDIDKVSGFFIEDQIGWVLLDEDLNPVEEFYDD